MSTPHSDPAHRQEVITPGGLSVQGPHRVESFAKCPQMEAFGHELHLRSIYPREATDVGVLWHDGLAYHYAAQLPVKPDWYVYKDSSEIIERRGATMPRSFVDTALAMMAKYREAYAVDDLHPILIEHQFVVTFPNGEPYSCRTDLLAWQWVTVPEPRWRCVVVDHKNVGKMGNESAKYYLDRQMVTNLALARAHGYPVEAVLVNVQSRRTYECRRFEVPINPIHYNRLFADTIYFLDQMKAVRQTHLDQSNRPRNTAACVGKFGQCDYYSLCWEGGSVGEFSTGK
jgi:hypothetical protein